MSSRGSPSPSRPKARISARRSRQGGLIARGVILTILSALTASTDLAGGVGDRRVELSGAEPVRDQELGIGQLVVDLSELAPGGPVAVSAEVGIGQLEVELPPDLPVRVRATSGIGRLKCSRSRTAASGPRWTTSTTGSRA